jgi:hypothetical protein
MSAEVNPLILYCDGNPSGTQVRFVSIPGDVNADLWLENRSSESVKLESATLLLPSALSDETDADQLEPTIEFPEEVPAHSRVPLSAAFNIGPTTPPGTYTGEIKVHSSQGTTRFEVAILVIQSYELSLDPEHFVFSHSDAEDLSSHLVVRNEGNVPIEVARLGDFPLRDPWHAVYCDPATDPESELRTKYSELVAVEDEDYGSLTIENDHTVIAPGNWSVVHFAIKLPRELPANAHLRAAPRVGTERFLVDILTPPAVTTRTPQTPRSSKRKA